MNIADRIQFQRKKSGMSQEELADRIGVSRQAVSKWESEQSTPDLERVIQLSELFDVTTDYLLRGIEPAKKAAFKVKPALVFAVVSTAMNVFGLLFGCAVWYDEQTANSLLPGLVFLVLGIMLYAMARFVVPGAGEKTICRVWWRVNIWPVLFIPLSLVYNLLTVGIPAPYPFPDGAPGQILWFWIIYIGAGIWVTLGTREK